MKNPDIFHVGDKIDLTKISHKENAVQKKNYASKLVDMDGESTLKISIPVEKHVWVPLELGDKYNLRIYTKKGVFQCSGLVRERYKEGSIAIATVEILSNFEKFQRREYYRVECIMDMKYHIVSEHEKLLREKLEMGIANPEKLSENLKKEYQHELQSLEEMWYNGVIVDISGGGMRFNSEHLHSAGEEVLIDLSLDISGKTQQIIVQSDLIASDAFKNRNDIYQQRVFFKAIPVADREAIIKFVFEEDRRKRKRMIGD